MHDCANSYTCGASETRHRGMRLVSLWQRDRACRGPEAIEIYYWLRVFHSSRLKELIRESQMFGLSDDIAADCFSISDHGAYPAKSKQLRKTSVEQLLKRNRSGHRRRNRLRTLRQPASRWPKGLRKLQLSTFAPSSPSARRQSRASADATHKLDELCAGLDGAPAAAEHGGEQHDIKILKSMRESADQSRHIAREASGPLSRRDYQALRICRASRP